MPLSANILPLFIPATPAIQSFGIALLECNSYLIKILRDNILLILFNSVF